VDTAKTITHLGLCAGYGGIELGIKRVIPTLRTVALCEIEAFAVANLVSKMEAGLMDAAPVWTDLKTFPWEEFRDRVDILTGGYPCQPFSAAGKRLGGEDPRHLWPHISRGISILQPRVCFFENVEGHITCGLHHVLCDLGRLGYRTAWGIFSASECGAPHQRKRVFILAYASSWRGESLYDWNSKSANAFSCGHRWPSRPGQPQYGWEPPRVVADSDRINRSAPAEGREHDRQVGSAGADMGDTKSGMPRQSSARDWREGAGGAGEAGQLGDTKSLRSGESTDGFGQAASWADASSDEDVGNTAEQGCQRSGRTNDPRGAINRPAEPNRGCANGEMEQSERQTQPSLGGDTDGSASGMDYAQLPESDHAASGAESEARIRGELAYGINNGCHHSNSRPDSDGEQEPLGQATETEARQDWVYSSKHGQVIGDGSLYISCDNRTDELRLLGNGVVPATATLAFRTLMTDLCSPES